MKTTANQTNMISTTFSDLLDKPAWIMLAMFSVPMLLVGYLLLVYLLGGKTVKEDRVAQKLEQFRRQIELCSDACCLDKIRQEIREYSFRYCVLEEHRRLVSNLLICADVREYRIRTTHIS
jgi:hypothetical protein